MRPVIELQQQSDSYQRGFDRSGIWFVEDEYIIAGEMVQSQFMAELHAKGSYGPLDFPRIERIYFPAAVPAIVGELAKLQPGDKAGVLNFVSTYGLLGFDKLVKPKPGIPNGDPLWWLWLHAKSVRLCLELTKALDENDDVGIQRLLDIQENGKFEFPTVAVRERKDGGWKSRADDVQAEARNIRAVIINANIKEISRAIETDAASGKIISTFKFSALAELLYWHLADACVSGQGVRRCKRPGCSGIFIAPNAKQQYCPRRWGEKGKSTCSGQNKQRKWRSNPENRKKERERNKERMRKIRKTGT